MKIENEVFIGAKGRASVLDFETPIAKDYSDLVIFVHGYKGFKDWGAWHLVQEYFVKNGLAFCKFNMSHNGGTVENPIDFPDLISFSENCYSYEVADVNTILNVLNDKINLDGRRIHLIGHSRGGGICMLMNGHPKITSITTWAGISNIENRFPKGTALKEWEKTGVYFVRNGRTKQEMPQQYTIYEDWQANQDLLSIEKAAKKRKSSFLHLHGNQDETVNLSEGIKLSELSGGELVIINNANHTFSSTHPYKAETMPAALRETCDYTLDFILNFSR